jgi:DNA mismatch endonuclease (patch repair protein)
MRQPYPIPTSAAVSAVMRANRKRDTRPELRLRSALHNRGLRFRLGVTIVAENVRVVPDVIFSRARLAVFVDGCWWHGCPEHANTPRSNTAYWVPKLARNVVRDRRVDAALLSAGWAVVRIWEHENVSDAADRLQRLLAGWRRYGRVAQE